MIPFFNYCLMHHLIYVFNLVHFFSYYFKLSFSFTFTSSSIIDDNDMMMIMMKNYNDY